MNENRYAPPAAAIESESRLLAAARWVLIGSIALHVVIFALAVPTLWEAMRVAMISALNALLTLLANALLLIGGLLLFTKSKSSMYVFGIGVIASWCSLSNFSYLIQYSSIAINVVAFIGSVVLMRSQRGR